MRHFIAIAVLGGGGFAFAGPISSEDVPRPEGIEFSGAEDTDIDNDGIVLVEVPEGTGYALPTEDHGDIVTVVALSGHSGATHLDVAGVERSAAGRAIDAPPGSIDAAQTGMQHDLGSGTVTNTVSPEPTPSLQVQRMRAEDPDLAEQPAPQADQATHQ